MTTHLRIFYALLWKEFREAWFFWLAAIVLAVAFSTSAHFQWKNDRLQLVIQQGFFSEPFLIPWFFVHLVGFMLFLPLLSREPERGVLGVYTAKPISPERLAFLQWLVTLLLAIVPVSIYLIIFSSRQYLAEIPPYAAYSVEYLEWHKVLLFLIPVSLIYYLVSSATSNRFRSFGLFLIGGVSIAVAFEYWNHRVALSSSPNLLSKAAYLFSIQPELSLALLGVALFLLTALLLRIRMTHGLAFPNQYPIAFILLAVIYGSFLYANVRNVNATQLAVDPAQSSDPLRDLVYKAGIVVGTEVDRETQEIKPVRNSMPWQTDDRLYRMGVSGNHFDTRFNVNAWVQSEVKNASEQVRLYIEKNASNSSTPDLQWRKVYQKELRELFNADSLQNREFYDRHNSWWNLSPWGIAQSETAALIGNQWNFSYNLIHEYSRKYGVHLNTFRVIWYPLQELSLEQLNRYEETGFEDYLNRRFAHFREFVKEQTGESTSISENMNPDRESSFRFLGRLTLEEQPQFTCIEAIDLDLLTEKGRIQFSREAAEPGVFEPTPFNQIILENPDVAIGNRANGRFIPSLPFTRFTDDNRTIDTTYMTRWIFLGGYLQVGTNINQEPHQSGSRFFRVLTSGFNFDENPTLACYDLSDPVRLKIYLGAELLDKFPHPKSWDEYTFAVSGNYLALVLNRDDRQILSLFDISNPAEMRELDRIESSYGFCLSNWPLRSRFGNNNDNTSFVFENDAILLRNNHVTAIYRVQPGGTLKADARVVYPNPARNVQNIACNGSELWLLLDDDSLLRFAIGPTSEKPGKNKEPVYLHDTQAYKDTLEAYKLSRQP